MSDESELARLTAEFLAAVSFTAGQRPAYDRIRELFIPEGLLIRNSGTAPEVTTVDEFIAPRLATVESGALSEFYEGERSEITEVFGNVAQRTSAYEKRGVLDGEVFAARGVIFTQFVRTPDGWRMSAMAWDDERPGLEIPARYA
jgi:hypothetical protein